MIERYSRPEMTRIWAPENRFRIWFEIEAHACDAQAALGVIPQSAARAVWERGAFEVERIDEIERETRHDVIAFLTNLAEHIGPEARFLHQGMTSSDVLDTCFAVQLKEAADILLADLDQLLAVLKRRAFEHKYTPTVGRSHGIHAEPTTFGLSSPGITPNSPATASGWSPPARRSRPARFPARSAPSPISTPRSKPMSRKSWASRRSPSRPRSSRATATPRSSWHWP